MQSHPHTYWLNTTSVYLRERGIKPSPRMPQLDATLASMASVIIPPGQGLIVMHTFMGLVVREYLPEAKLSGDWAPFAQCINWLRRDIAHHHESRVQHLQEALKLAETREDDVQKRDGFFFHSLTLQRAQQLKDDLKPSLDDMSRKGKRMAKSAIATFSALKSACHRSLSSGSPECFVPFVSEAIAAHQRRHDDSEIRMVELLLQSLPALKVEAALAA